MTTDAPLLPGGYYHIYNRGNNGADVFLEERNYRYFLKLYAHHIQPVAATLAYCLLRNHFHFFVRIRTDEERLALQTGAVSPTDWSSLEDCSSLQSPLLKPAHRHFNNLFIAYAKAINKAYQRSGSLLEKPYRRKIVDNEAYFSQLIAYIHQNPQKHGFVDDFRDWPWSSYRAGTSTQPTILAREFVLGCFNGRDPFINAHQTAASETEIGALIEGDWT